MRIGTVAASAVLVFTLSHHAESAPPPLDGFLFFAQHELRLKGFQASSGDFGVSDGLLYAGGQLTAPASTLVAPTVRLDGRSTCAQLLANVVTRAAAGCGPATPVSAPIVTDLAAACGFPAPFPDCDASQPVSVSRGGTQTLAPGTYGALVVAHEGRLTLTGGTYRFCSVATSRRSQVLVQSASTITVNGRLSIGPQGTIAPADPALGPDAVRVFVAGGGEAVQLSHHSQDTMRICAPNGLMEVIVGSALDGTFAADVVHSERGTGGTPSTTTTTSTTSTTSTSSTVSTSSTTTTATLPEVTTTSKPATTTTTKASSTTSLCPTTTTTTTPVCDTTTTTMPMMTCD